MKNKGQYESDSRRRQVKTLLDRHGREHYVKSGSKGGKANSTKFDSSSGKKAADKRWQKVREKAKQSAREDNDVT